MSPGNNMHKRNIRIDADTHTNLDAKAENGRDCVAMGEVLNRIGDKWSVMIIGALSNGPVRFNELRRVIGGISQRMLTRTLRNLERDGVLTRTHYPEIPPRVEYELTSLGKTLEPVIKSLWDWSVVHFDDIEAARSTYDRR